MLSELRSYPQMLLRFLLWYSIALLIASAIGFVGSAVVHLVH